jgi:hypothetical protein
MLLVVLWVWSYHRLGLLECKWSATRAIAVGAANVRIVVLEVPSTFLSAWSSLLDADVDIVLEQDPAMITMKQTLALAEFAKSHQRGITSQRRSRLAPGIDRKIAMINQQMQQYRQQTRQQAAVESLSILSPSRSKSGPFLSKVMHRLGFGFNRFPGGWALVVPFWFPVTLAASLTALLGMESRWRFSLRTLLIAITLVALTLGLIIATTR